MAKVTFRLPSKVQFGYVEIVGEAEELGIPDIADPHAVGKVYMDYVTAYKRSEAGSVTAASKEAPEPSVDELLRSELGAREISSTTSKPWENKPKAEASSKPWESAADGGEDDWDI